MERLGGCKQCLTTGYFVYPSVEMDSLVMSSSVSLPFPSYYHWHENVREIPWAETRINERTTFATFAGSEVVMVADHTRLRRVLVRQCEQHNDYCLKVDMSQSSKHSSSNTSTSEPNIKAQSFFQDVKRVGVARAEVAGMLPTDSSAIMTAYSHSVFCFVPPGDIISH
jgi:hypothetical protein